MKIIFYLFILFFSMGIAGMFFFVGFWLSPQDELEQSEAIVVISGGETLARTKEGIRIFNEGYASYLIFSGAAKDGEISNAAAMKKIALANQISFDKILLEEKSKNTYENAVFVKKILERKNIKKIILVTSPYHQQRASITFRSVLGQDYKIINHSALDSTWRRSRWWQSFNSIELTLQELYKIIYIKVTGKFS